MGIPERNPPVTFPLNFPVDARGSCQLVADLLATRQTILTCEDVANKSATSWQQVVVTCNGIWETARHNRCNGLLLAPMFYGFATGKLRETGVMDFGHWTRTICTFSSIKAGKSFRFLVFSFFKVFKVFKRFWFFRFQYTKKTGHKISTQEEHPIHHSLCHIVFYKI